VQSIAKDDHFVLRGVRHVVTHATPTHIHYRAANTTRTPYEASKVAFHLLEQAEIIVRINP
jgi:hypothetical protein